MASWLQFTDDIGLRVELEHPPKRVVSLVPSWTQTLFALGAGEMLVAATRFCVEPTGGAHGHSQNRRHQGTRTCARSTKRKPDCGDRQRGGKPPRGYRASARAGSRGAHHLSSAHGAGRGRIDLTHGPCA